MLGLLADLVAAIMAFFLGLLALGWFVAPFAMLLFVIVGIVVVTVAMGLAAALIPVALALAPIALIVWLVVAVFSHVF